MRACVRVGAGVRADVWSGGRAARQTRLRDREIETHTQTVFWSVIKIPVKFS